ncbi:DUF1642 domain-containing protein [Lactococcus lactis]|uniref:DUF1642 domain-containing protein n=1 Tax=Lactococcus lactis TaxID=1358 RepID=UPI0021A28470|nr:DUF1642 domain-containing protein [Lactococcus lactis]MCT0052077.1 DUF1642 domain-containing protein [Lactococcus lactis subsp. lactis]
MTKFEEILRKIKPRKKFLEFNAGITYWYCLSDLIQKFGNWHSDEEFQELLDKYSNLNDNYEKEVIKSSKLESQIIGLKSQLQQQALPVVPECVGKYIEDCKKEGDCLFGVFADATRVEHDMPDLVYFWLGDEGNNDELFAHAWLDGYTVEKPQLFYLKNKITGKYLRSYTGLSMDDRTLRYEEVNDKRVGGFGGGTTFTQQEIDSIDTGSYEQIEVAE